MKHALENDLAFIRCCGSCGKEACRLYVLTEGTMAGVSYCIDCAVETLNDEELQ
jgi:hypothetical protein